jgi:hypothetical protein
VKREENQQDVFTRPGHHSGVILYHCERTGRRNVRSASRCQTSILSTLLKVSMEEAPSCSQGHSNASTGAILLHGIPTPFPTGLEATSTRHDKPLYSEDLGTWGVLAPAPAPRGHSLLVPPEAGSL